MLLMVKAFQGKDSVTTLVLTLKLISHLKQVKLSWNWPSFCVRGWFCVKVTQGHFFSHQGRKGKSKAASVCTW